MNREEVWFTWQQSIGYHRKGQDRSGIASVLIQILTAISIKPPSGLQ